MICHIRMVLGALAGAVVLFGWQWASWSLVPLIHGTTVDQIGMEEKTNDDLAKVGLRSGAYVSPWLPPGETDEKEIEKWKKKATEGPSFLLLYHSGPRDVMNAQQFGRGFAITLAGALIAAYIVSQSTGGFSKRYLISLLLGVFLATMAHLANWNWMPFPWEYTRDFMADNVIGWALAGLPIGLVVCNHPVPGAST